VGIAYAQVWHTLASLDGQAILARILAARGQWQESFNRLEQALQMAKGKFSMGDIFLAIHLARLMLLHDELAQALHVMRLFDLENAATEIWYHLWEPLQLLFYRAQIAASGGTPAEAEAVAAIEGLAALIEKAAHRERLTHQIEALILLAYAQEQAGQPAAAAKSLSRALTLGARSGYLRVFADEGKRLLRLLEDHRARLKAPPAYREQLLHVLRQESGRRAPSQKASLAGLTSLTRRELDILSLMAAGRSNQEIADERVLALNTVKKHVANILGKMGVSNRTQAVMLARQLGWLK
jgi:LuxR family transcriptional regulator, maltose regulon positive regulatory protein